MPDMLTSRAIILKPAHQAKVQCVTLPCTDGALLHGICSRRTLRMDIMAERAHFMTASGGVRSCCNLSWVSQLNKTGSKSSLQQQLIVHVITPPIHSFKDMRHEQGPMPHMVAVIKSICSFMNLMFLEGITYIVAQQATPQQLLHLAPFAATHLMAGCGTSKTLRRLKHMCSHTLASPPSSLGSSGQRCSYSDHALGLRVFISRHASSLHIVHKCMAVGKPGGECPCVDTHS